MLYHTCDKGCLEREQTLTFFTKPPSFKELRFYQHADGVLAWLSLVLSILFWKQNLETGKEKGL